MDMNYIIEFFSTCVEILFSLLSDPSLAMDFHDSYKQILISISLPLGVWRITYDDRRRNIFKLTLMIPTPPGKTVTQESLAYIDEYLELVTLIWLVSCQTFCKKLERVSRTLPGQPLSYVPCGETGGMKIYEFYIRDFTPVQLFTALKNIGLARYFLQNLNSILTYEILDHQYEPLSKPRRLWDLLPTGFNFMVDEFIYIQASFHYVQLKVVNSFYFKGYFRPPENGGH